MHLKIKPSDTVMYLSLDCEDISQLILQMK